MDEKMQKIINSVDSVIEKLQVIPKLIDKLLDVLKRPILKCIPYSYLRIMLFKDR